MKALWHLSLIISLLHRGVGAARQVPSRFPDSVNLKWAAKDYVIKDPNWLKMIFPLICIKKDNRAPGLAPYTYYNNTCLTANANGRLWGSLAASPGLAVMEPNSGTLPRTGMWLGIMDVNEVKTGGNTQGGGPERNTFVIANSLVGLPNKPRCLTWQNKEGGNKPDMDLLEQQSVGFGEAFGAQSSSLWSGRVVLEECSYIKNWTYPLDFSKISDNQKFWVTKEEGDTFNESLVSSVRRRIMPKLPAVKDPWALCLNRFGIFDSWEFGRKPDYFEALSRGTIDRTTIGWGCSPQRWTLVGTTAVSPDSRKDNYSFGK
ncbi:hypothetical protein TWF718_009789 [Orbilia javanica]|uniref:Uncharacterized protein n=1 Tax=Orbilia javanica TaxID=47235 RepID=A0AAN8RLP2_9PEZI